VARKGSLWLPLDVNFMDDPKVIRAGEQAGWLYVAMSLFCKRVGTDGLMMPEQVERLGVNNWRKRLDALLREELVVLLDDGQLAIAAWLLHNDSADEVAEKRRRDADRKRRGKGQVA
jgi:hypothetical protein